MSDENKTTDKLSSVFAENIATIISPEGIQKYILGTKKNGTPRAIYDVVKDYTRPKKKKKKNKNGKKQDIPTSYSFYLSASNKGKKKKKKNKDKTKHWHI